MAMIYEPCVDGPDLAASARASLAIDRDGAWSLGHSTLGIIAQGWYTSPLGRQVDLAGAIEAATSARMSLPADAPLPAAPPKGAAGSGECRVSVRNESTMVAAARLGEEHGRVLALNMANGAHPGGGWLSGARAQEETLCRSSTLYATIEHDPMYPAHRQRDDTESTHAAIVSPHIAVFRDDTGRLLDVPWTMDVLTCAAPVATRVGQPRAGDLLQGRVERILDIAVALGYEALVLGAWGCGAFGNDGRRAAADFHRALRARSQHFREVVFAITDWSDERRFLGPFRDELAPRPA